MQETTDLATLNAASSDEFVRLLAGIYEHSPWIAAAAHGRAPFGAAQDVRDALRDAVMRAPPARQLQLLLAHPELAGKEARSGELTAHSSDEQKGAGLVNLSDAERIELAGLNQRYRDHFGFPFIIAVRHHTKSGILAELRRRALGSDVEREFATCLEQVHEIAWLRLQGLLGP